MLEVFLTVILPTFLVAALGALLQRWKILDVGAMGPVAMYLLSPALVLDGLLTTALPGEISLLVVITAFVSMTLMIVVGFVLTIVAHLPRSLQSGYTLSTGFANAGNMGIPISYLAFGEQGLAVAIIIFVVQGSLSWPVGIYVAARGQAHGLAPCIAAMKVPTVYAVPVALLIRSLEWQLPIAIGKPIDMLAAATIPVMLVILGFQLSHGIDWSRWRSLISSSTLRLVVSAVVAYGITMLFGLTGVAQQTVIVVAAMPTAVFTTILATEFDAEPKFVTSAVVISTLTSIGTLTVLITLVRNFMG